MSPFLRRLVPLITTVGLVSTAALACTGTIERDPARGLGTEPNDPGPVGGAPDEAANEAVRNQDDAMQAEDPELFDLATMYFPGQVPAGGNKRLFRLTRAQLDATTQSLLPTSYSTSLSATMPRDPLQTNYEYGDNLSWNAANLTPYATWVAEIAGRVGQDPTTVIHCAAQADAPSCLEQQAQLFVRRAFREIATDDQVARFSSFFLARSTESGVAEATADLVDVALTSPSYVFREEVSTDPVGVLLPANQLQNVTYTLADAPPDALGLSAEASGLTAEAQVGTDAARALTVDDVLATPQARDKLLRFFFAWLEIREIDEFGLSESVFPEWTPEVAAAAVEETRAFLERGLAAAAPSLKGITQSTDAFVSEATAFLYGVDGSASGTFVELDPNQRLGIFTQPAVIASHSGPTTTRLVKRGVFFTRKIMCLPLGAPPAGVDLTVPMTPGATERQRIESITTVQPCAGCHAFINPFGFMQEGYDALGRFRTNDESGLPIDARISVDFLDEGQLTTTSGVEALRGFTSSARFKQCFARQLFRFYMGRDESTSDDPVLRQMFFSFARNDEQAIVEMLKILAGSSSFTHRETRP